jgi:hypothetical protein
VLVKVSAPIKGGITSCMDFALYNSMDLFDLCIGRIKLQNCNVKDYSDISVFLGTV